MLKSLNTYKKKSCTILEMSCFCQKTVIEKIYFESLISIYNSYNK